MSTLSRAIAAFIALAPIAAAQEPPSSQPATEHEKSKPFVALSEEGGAARLLYTIPEPTSYPGRYYITLDDVNPATFKEKAYEELEETHRYCYTERELRSMFKNELPPVASALRPNQFTGANVGMGAASVSQHGARVLPRTSLFGTSSAQLIPCAAKLPPPVTKLMIIESYRLTSFAGDYGAGRTIKTFTLFPGEKTTITVKTYQRRSETRKQASSILDSFTEESAEAFEKSLSREQSDKQSSSESEEYKAEAHAEQGWGTGNASVDAAAALSTNASREEFSKNVRNAMNKHSNSASSKRDISVSSSSEITQESGEESETQRVVENINVSRTLNLVFRQMNQQFVSVLHLTDIRVAFYRRQISDNVVTTVYKEVPLPELSTFLQNILTTRADALGVETAIIRHITGIRDYEGNLVADFVVSLGGGQGRQINRLHKSTFKDPITEKAIPGTVQGIAVSGSTNVLRTDGVIVEAVLGQGNALDAYSKGLQDESVRLRQFANEKEALRLKIVKDNDTARATLFEQLFREPAAAPRQSTP